MTNEIKKYVTVEIYEDVCNKNKTQFIQCKICDGKGKIYRGYLDAQASWTESNECGTCNGIGKIRIKEIIKTNKWKKYDGPTGKEPCNSCAYENTPVDGENCKSCIHTSKSMSDRIHGI